MKTKAMIRFRIGRPGALRRRSLTVFAALFVLALAGVGAAYAYWSSSDSTASTAFAKADAVLGGATPGVVASGSSATITWTASALNSNQVGLSGYLVKRYDAATASQTVGASCAGTITSLSCTENNVPDGTWTYTVTPVFGPWRGTESPKSIPTPVGSTKLVFTSSPQTAVAGTSTGLITVQRQDARSIATTVGSRTVTLASNAGPGTFRNPADTAVITTVTIPDGQSGVTFRYRDTLAGTPQITATSGTLTTATQNVTVNAAAASQLSITSVPVSPTAGSAFSPQPQVTVQDAFANTVLTAANKVTLSIKTGTGTSGATLSGCSTNPVTAVNGVAQFAACAIDKSGTGYQLTASASGLSAANSSPFNVSPGAAAKLVFSQQPTSATAGATLTPAVTVRIEDANGNLTMSTANVVMGFGTNAGSGTLSGTTNVAAVNGVAAFNTLSVDKAASAYTLQATSGTLTAATSATFNVTVAAANKLVFSVQPVNTVAGTPVTPAVTVRIEDAYGNLTASTATVSTAIGTNPGGGTLTGTTSANAVAGVATFSNLKINKTGIGYTLVASSSPLTAATSNAFNITPGTPTALKFSQQPTHTVAGTFFTPGVTVRIEDVNGNLTTSTATVTVAIGTNPGSGTLSGTATVAAAAGLATFNDLSINKVGTGYTLTATSGALSVDTSTAFNITVATANRLTFAVQPTSAVAGVVLSPAVTVRIEDAFGNLVTTSAATVSAALTTPGGATLSGTTTVTATGGVATFTSLSVNKTGSYTLTASSTALTASFSSSFTISHAATATLTYTTQPSGSTGGISFASQPVVTLKDSLGNLVTTPEPVTLSVTGNPSVGFSCTTTTVQSNTSAQATFAGCKINTAGSYTLTATDGTITAISSAVTVTTGPAATLTFSTQPSPTTTAGVAFAAQPAVTVKDAGGNLVSGDSVVLSVTGNPSVGLSCTSTAVTSNASGVATFAGCKITKAGSYTLTATDGAATVASSTVTINPAAVSTATFSIQPSSTTTAGVSFTTQPAVTVTDAFGNARSGDSVVLSVTGNPVVGFSCTNTTVTTDATGKATFAGCKITKAGTYSLVGTDGAVSATSSSVSVNAAAAFSATFATQPSTSTTAGVVFAAQPIVTVADTFGNLVSGDSVVLSVTGNPSVGLSCTSTAVTSNASGVATFAGCNITKAGSYTLTATDGAATVASSTVTINPATASIMQLSNCALNGGTILCSSPFALGNAGTLTARIDVFDAFGNVPAPSAFTITLTSGNTGEYTVTSPATISGTGSPTNRSTQFTVLKTNNAGTTTTVTASSSGLTPLVFTVTK